MANVHGDCCQARSSILCEINNGIIIDSQIEPLNVDERSLAIKHIEYFEEFKQDNDLIIFDRGYPSRELIDILENKNIKYLMRVQKSFNKEIDSSDKDDFKIEIKYNNKLLKIRVIRVILDTDEIEMLITNLTENEFKQEDFKELYFKRWPIETKFNTVKNKLKIETFSGKTKISIQQDFYATMYLANIVSVSKMESDKEITKDNQSKTLKHEYQTNESLLISKLKDKLILALLIDDIDKRQRIVDKIINEAIQNRSPKRPDRHYKRSNEENSHCYRKRRKAIKRYNKTAL